jgi:hypothetical protein
MPLIQFADGRQFDFQVVSKQQLSTSEIDFKLSRKTNQVFYVVGIDKVKVPPTPIVIGDKNSIWVQHQETYITSGKGPVVKTGLNDVEAQKARKLFNDIVDGKIIEPIELNKSKEHIEDKGDRFWIFIAAIIITLLIWANASCIASYFNPNSQGPLPLGDKFDVVNTLFSALAAAGIIYTVYMQRHELSLQREEMKLQRGELSKANEEQKVQSQLMQSQISSLRQTDEFNKYIKYMESEPFFVTGVTWDINETGYTQLEIYNKGEDIYNVLYSAVFENIDSVYKQTDFLHLPNGSKFWISCSTGLAIGIWIELHIMYRNKLNIETKKVLIIDLVDRSITEKYNSYLEGLDIPEFYLRKNNVLFIKH